MAANDQESEPPAVDVLRTDPTGEIDVEQIEHNLSLTVEQRMEQYFLWMRFVEIARAAGRQYYGMDPRPPETAE